MHLYEISNDYRAIMALLEETDATDAVGMEAVSNALEQVGGEFVAKATAVVHYSQNIAADVAMIDAELDRLKKRRDSIAKRGQWLTDYLFAHMQLTGISEVNHPANLFTIKLQNNPPSVVVDDEAAIPAKFMTQPEPPAPRPDKKAIQAALKEGEDVPGVHIEQKQRLVIK